MVELVTKPYLQITVEMAEPDIGIKGEKLTTIKAELERLLLEFGMAKALVKDY